MLSRREKLLVQPWQDRRYRDHRSKVVSVRSAVDSSCPASRPHVRVKAARARRERERAARVQADNYRLLQRLARIMAVNRLDNHWEKPLPNFHQKVGRYFTAVPSRPTEFVSPEPSLAGVKCYACEFRKMKTHQQYRDPSSLV